MYHFSALARRTHEFSGALYAAAALLAFLYYRSTRQRLVLVIAAILMLFGESAYLFRFSYLWDSTWWTWHAVKAGLYVGTLVVIAAGLVVALRAVELARTGQVAANRKLRRAHDELGLVNHELQIRNAMVNASINARGLDQTLAVIEAALAELLGSCRYTLVLRVPEDEIAELQRSMRRQVLRWAVRVSPDSAPCVRLARAVGGTGEELVHTCTPAGEAHTCMCLVLRAHDQVFGYLQIHSDRADAPRRTHQQLDVLSAEIGPIVHNALLHYRWVEAVAFRTSLSRVAAILGSTLDTPNVLEAVCRESAQLLGSEASAILLAGEPGGKLQMASCCMLGAAANGTGAAQPAWIDSDEGRVFFDRLRDAGRPLALVKQEVPTLSAFPLGTPECLWNALAVFPMLSNGKLMAVMLIMRRERVPFSDVTLEQGELLAEQVRVALANARAYEAVRRTNEQLRHSEEERVRAERLALMGQMAASVAHEVRNPLSAINNCLAVLRRSMHLHSAAAVPAMEIIDDEVQRLERLTRNFISFGRSPRSAQTRVHLDTLVARICEGIERHIQHEGLEIGVTREIRGDGDAVMFDVDGFQELLWNLLLNAVQAIDGPGTVRVRLASRHDAVFLAVVDSGPGVPRADRARIFEPFFSKRSQGAGLGLAIVHQQVGTWGGRLRVCGPPGACFALRFPVSAAVDVEAAS
jgi:signal transduction histidine kinase/HAMP domain-containing protein